MVTKVVNKVNTKTPFSSIQTLKKQTLFTWIFLSYPCK